MTIASRAWAGVVALVLLAPAVAGAQSTPNPFAQLFGREPERTGRQYTAVQFRTSARTQVGRTIEDGFVGTPDNVVPSGLSAGGDASLTADYVRDRVQLNGRGSYRYQEFRQEPSFGVPAIDAGARAIFKATTRLTFDAGAQFLRSPFFSSFWLTADQAGSMAPLDRAAILLMPNDTVEGTASMTSNYSSRSSVSLSATARDTKFDTQTQLDSSSVGGRAEWSRRLTRDLGLRAGYGRYELRSQGLDGDQVFVNELIDIGVDYGQSLSLARRTFFSFGTQTSILQDQDSGRHFRLNGNVMLQHRFKRSWSTSLSARRGADFIPGFREPVLSDSAQLSLQGYLSKRLNLAASADGGRGEVGFDDVGDFTSYSGNAKLTLAMTRHLGLFTQYGYYRYESTPQLDTLFLMPRGVRHAVAFGVQAWISLYDKEKVTRDPR